MVWARARGDLEEEETHFRSLNESKGNQGAGRTEGLGKLDERTHGAAHLLHHLNRRQLQSLQLAPTSIVVAPTSIRAVALTRIRVVAPTRITSIRVPQSQIPPRSLARILPLPPLLPTLNRSAHIPVLRVWGQEGKGRRNGHVGGLQSLNCCLHRLPCV